MLLSPFSRESNDTHVFTRASSVFSLRPVSAPSRSFAGGGGGGGGPRQACSPQAQISLRRWGLGPSGVSAIVKAEITESLFFASWNRGVQTQQLPCPGAGAHPLRREKRGGFPPHRVPGTTGMLTHTHPPPPPPQRCWATRKISAPRRGLEPKLSPQEVRGGFQLRTSRAGGCATPRRPSANGGSSSSSLRSRGGSASPRH